MPVTTNIALYAFSAHVTQTREMASDNCDVEVGLPTSVLAHSLIALDEAGRIVSTSIKSPLSIGDEINGPSGRVGTAVYKDRRWRGRLIAWSEKDGVTMINEHGQRLVVPKYDAIELAHTGELSTRLLLKMDSICRESITWTYRMRDVGWSAFGTVVLLPNNNALLRVAAKIFNGSDMVLEGNVTLVASQVPNEHLEISRGQPSEDPHVYKIGSLALPQAATVRELFDVKLQSHKLYVCETAQGLSTVQRGFRFTAPQYIPPCTLQIYASDEPETSTSNLLSRFVGESTIVKKETGQEVFLLLGVATTVDVSTTLQHDNDTYNNELTERVRATITNRNIIPVTIVLRHTTQHHIMKVHTISPNASVEYNSTSIVWMISVAPNVTLNFEADLVLLLS